MTDNYKGIIIEESLSKKDVLKNLKKIHTKIKKFTEDHKTPWITQWTMHTVEIIESKVDSVAKEISTSLD